MLIDNLDVVITKYIGHLTVYNVFQHVTIFNLKLYSRMICIYNVAKQQLF